MFYVQKLVTINNKYHQQTNTWWKHTNPCT